jgi:hypothetical protein
MFNLEEDLPLIRAEFERIARENRFYSIARLASNAPHPGAGTWLDIERDLMAVPLFPAPRSTVARCLERVAHLMRESPSLAIPEWAAAESETPAEWRARVREFMLRSVDSL